MQGKLFQWCTHLLYCSVLSLCGNLNTRRMSQPDMGSIFHIKKIIEIFWSKETTMWIIIITKFKGFYPPRILNKHWCIYSCLRIPPRENWLQYVYRVYTTAIDFPCNKESLYFWYWKFINFSAEIWESFFLIYKKDIRYHIQKKDRCKAMLRVRRHEFEKEDWTKLAK